MCTIINLHCRYPEHSNVKQAICYKSCDVIGKEIKVESNYTEKTNQRTQKLNPTLNITKNTFGWSKIILLNFTSVTFPNIQRTEKDGAVHFTTTPCKPNIANRYTESHIFCKILRTFLCFFMTIFRVLLC